MTRFTGDEEFGRFEAIVADVDRLNEAEREREGRRLNLVLMYRRTYVAECCTRVETMVFKPYEKMELVTRDNAGISYQTSAIDRT